MWHLFKLGLCFLYSLQQHHQSIFTWSQHIGIQLVRLKVSFEIMRRPCRTFSLDSTILRASLQLSLIACSFCRVCSSSYHAGSPVKSKICCLWIVKYFSICSGIQVNEISRATCLVRHGAASLLGLRGKGTFMTIAKRVKNLPFLLLEQVPVLACTGLSFLPPVVAVACSLQPSLLMMLQALGFVAFVL